MRAYTPLRLRYSVGPKGSTAISIEVVTPFFFTSGPLSQAQIRSETLCLAMANPNKNKIGYRRILLFWAKTPLHDCNYAICPIATYSYESIRPSWGGGGFGVCPRNSRLTIEGKTAVMPNPHPFYTMTTCGIG
jgi:hypothetical protein